MGDFRKTHVIRDLMLLLMERVGSKLDIQKMASELGISRPTLYEFLSFLEGTYFIHRVKPFSLSKDVELRGGAFEVKLNGSQNDFFRLQALAGELKIRQYFLVSKRYTPTKGVLYPFQV